MLDDETVVQLLDHCESRIGCKLSEIRGNLRDEQWLSAIWELIVLDAALEFGSVKYELKTSGAHRPDFFFEKSNIRFWIEAAFLRDDRNRHFKKAQDHPVFRVLKEKGRKAKGSALSDPYMVFLGTDRVFDINSSRHTQGVDSVEAVRKAFQSQRSLSAVVLVPIFATFEIFQPLRKRAKPRLYANSDAHMPLTDPIVEVINRLDFERWPFDLFLRPDLRRVELCKALDQASPTNGPSSRSRGPRPPAQVPYPRWTYVWRFNRLCISKAGDKYLLFKNDEYVDVEGGSADEVAQYAAELFQIFPAHVLGPDGPMPHPDPGVPPDLNKWKIEPSGKNHGGSVLHGIVRAIAGFVITRK